MPQMLDEYRVRELLAAVGARTPAPASGAVSALTAALAAALAELSARFAGDERATQRAAELVAELVRLADDDVDAYTAFMAERSEAARARIIEVPEAIAVRADEVAELADAVRTQLTTSVAGDAEASAELARAAARVARRLAELNA
jgi:methenyltetrahydrofolate cyclohydrolase